MASRRPDRLRWWRWLSAVGVLLIAGSVVVRLSLASAAFDRPDHQPAAAYSDHWVTAWAASPQLPTRWNLSAAGFDRQTIRNIVFSSIGATTIRVRFTNAFGSLPLQIGHAAVGVVRGGAGLAAAEEPLSFAGHRSAAVGPGAELVSDPVRLPVRALQRLAVSVFVSQPSGPATEHAQAQQISYVAAGDHVLDSEPGAFTTQTRSWYFIDSLDVLSSEPGAGTLIAVGDSITDGVGSSVGADARWPDDLARRLAADGDASGSRSSKLSVVDEGIGGNRLLTASRCCGAGLVARFANDALSRAASAEVILLEGINDIGLGESAGVRAPSYTQVAAQIVAGYQQIIRRAHAAGLTIFGGTLTPFQGARYWSAAGEAAREAVNRWILTSGAFDGVIDFAAALSDPVDPAKLAVGYDSGDHLHPNDAGYRAMADAVSLPALLDRP